MIVQAEDELAAIGIVIGAMWNGARAFTPTSGPGHLADGGVHRPRVLRRGPGRAVRRAARRPVDRHADAHAAVRPARLRLRQPRRHAPRDAVPGFPGGELPDGGAGIRPRRAPADAGVRDARPRHRHERLDVARLQVGRRLAPGPRQDADARADRRHREVPALPRPGRRRHPVPDAAGRQPEGRLLHARLGPQPLRRLHRGLGGVPGRARPPDAQVRDRGEARAAAP